MYMILQAPIGKLGKSQDNKYNILFYIYFSVAGMPDDTERAAPVQIVTSTVHIHSSHVPMDSDHSNTLTPLDPGDLHMHESTAACSSSTAD